MKIILPIKFKEHIDRFDKKKFDFKEDTQGLVVESHEDNVDDLNEFLNKCLKKRTS